MNDGVQVGDLVTFKPHPARQPDWFVTDILGDVALLVLKTGSGTDTTPRHMRRLVKDLTKVSASR